MRVLITGGTGTISSGLVAESVRQGNETFAITRGNNGSRNIKGAHYIKADVWNEEEIMQMLGKKNFDVVVECLVYNCEQLKISLKNFANRCNQYIFISTAGVYNRNDSKNRIRENVNKNQIEWSYTKGKIECEDFLIKFFKDKQNKYTIIRPTVTYGDYRIPYPIATRNPTWTLFERLTRNIPIIACTNVKHSVIHIYDFSRAVVGLFENEKAFYEDFHISSNKSELYWDDVIYESGKILNIIPKIIHIPIEVIKCAWSSIYDELRYNKTTDLIMDDSKLKSVIPNFNSEISIEEGLKNTIETARQEFMLHECNLDNVWWENCDITILYALYSNKISGEEKKYAREYIKTWSIKRKAVLSLKCLKRALKKH